MRKGKSTERGKLDSQSFLVVITQAFSVSPETIKQVLEDGIFVVDDIDEAEVKVESLGNADLIGTYKAKGGAK